jgi:hypothetical protein
LRLSYDQHLDDEGQVLLSSGCVRIAATARPLASVVSAARRIGSNVRSKGEVESASFIASKLACAADVHANRALWLPSAVSGAAIAA